MTNSGRFPAGDPMHYGLKLFAVVHGMASLELRCYLGDEKQARRLWLEAVTAVLTGFQTRAPDPV